MAKQDWQKLYDRADAAGRAAAQAAVPEPMYVVGHNADGSRHYYPPVMDGVCGFAWVNIRPGNHPFVNWLKKRGIGHKSYYGGYDIWIGAYGQSYERKYVHAQAMAKVLAEEGIQAYASGRLD